MPNKKYVIISPCKPRTGSTFLANAIMGFIAPQDFVKHVPKKDVDRWFKRPRQHNGILVVKTHLHHSIPWWNDDARKREFTPLFVYMTRGERTTEMEDIPGLEIKYKDILETPERPLEKIVEEIGLKLREFLPDEIPMHPTETAVERIKGMNRMVKALKPFPFKIHDNFYHIHGSHRNRS